MTAKTPEAYWDDDRQAWLCGLCGQRTVVPELGMGLADLIKLVRAHQRSEVCG
jgi:hypothetical protein